MFPVYTKTFGGKIGNFLHSVSPDNIFGKKFKSLPSQFFRQKYTNTISCKKIKREKCQIPSTLQNALTNN